MMCLCRMLRICYNFVRGADRMKEELFDDLILERGYEYAQEGAVDHVRNLCHCSWDRGLSCKNR